MGTTQPSMQSLWNTIVKDVANERLGLPSEAMRSLHDGLVGVARDVLQRTPALGVCRKLTVLEVLLGVEEHEPHQGPHCGPGCGCEGLHNI